MKNIVSFTLFGTNPKYYVGAEENINQIQTMMPDWEVRIYYHEQMILDGYVNKLTDLGGNLVNVKDISFTNKETIHYPYFWRFFSFLESCPSIVRDLDSRFSNREFEYIKKWLDSENEYFIIRDHPWHAPIPSGLFGMKGKNDLFVDHFKNFIDNNELVWGTDQEILMLYFEQVGRSNIFYCGYDDLTNYIPRDDKNFFIGMQVDENNKPLVPSAIQALDYLTGINL